MNRRQAQIQRKLAPSDTRVSTLDETMDRLAALVTVTLATIRAERKVWEWQKGAKR